MSKKPRGRYKVRIDNLGDAEELFFSRETSLRHAVRLTNSSPSVAASVLSAEDQLIYSSEDVRAIANLSGHRWSFFYLLAGLFVLFGSRFLGSPRFVTYCLFALWCAAFGMAYILGGLKMFAAQKSLWRGWLRDRKGSNPSLHRTASGGR